MRKATIFLLLMSLSLILAGAVSAAPEVDLEVDDENGEPVTVANPGDEVNVTANATTDEYLFDPAVLITVDPESGLTFNEDEAVMIYDGVKYNNDPVDPFLYWDDSYNAWVWYIGWVYGDQYPDEEAQLYAPAKISTTGEIKVFADYYQWPQESDFPILVATDNFTFQSIAAEPVSGETVPMQNTGTPFAAAALGLISIIGGTVYGKLR